MNHLRQAWAAKIAMPAIPPLPPGAWESQSRQYPPIGTPGINYFKGEINSEWYVDCLLAYNDQEFLVGILNHFPMDMGPERKGNVNVLVHPDGQRKGLGTALLREAMSRWSDIDLSKQDFTPAGKNLIRRVKKGALSYNPERDLPPSKPGTKPVPSGAVRCTHHTWSRNLSSILSQGLKGSYAQQFDYTGEGIWAAAGVSEGLKAAMRGGDPGDRIWVEFWTPTDTLYIGQGTSASFLEQRNAHVVCPDVPVSHFLGVYLGWHLAYWVLKSDPRHLKEIHEGFFDNLITDPQQKDTYGKAIKFIKDGR